MRDAKLLVLLAAILCLAACSQGIGPEPASDISTTPESGISPGGTTDCPSGLCGEGEEATEPGDVAAGKGDGKEVEETPGTPEGEAGDAVHLRTYLLKPKLVDDARFVAEIKVRGGSGAYAWQISGLPAGSTFQARTEGGKQQLEGPWAPGNFSVPVKVCDAADEANCAQRSYVLALNDSSGKFTSKVIPSPQSDLREPRKAESSILPPPMLMPEQAVLVASGTVSGQPLQSWSCGAGEVLAAWGYGRQKVDDILVPNIGCLSLIDLIAVQPIDPKHPLWWVDLDEGGQVSPEGFALAGAEVLKVKEFTAVTCFGSVCGDEPKASKILRPGAKRLDYYGIDDFSFWKASYPRDRGSYIESRRGIECPAGSALNGLSVFKDNVLSGNCVPVFSKGSSRRPFPGIHLSKEARTVTPSGDPAIGNGGGESCELLCDDDEVAIGMATYWNGDRDNIYKEWYDTPKYKAMALYCMKAELLNDPSDWRGWNWVTSEGALNTETVRKTKRCGGSDRSEQPVFVAFTHRVMTGIQGNSGAEVDEIGPIGRYLYRNAKRVSPASTYGTKSGGGKGGPFPDLECGNNQVLRGVTVSVGRRIYSIDSISCVDVSFR